MELTFLGGTREVGRLGVLVEDKNQRIMLDYGIKINGVTTLPLPVQGFLDASIISHAHLDHCGAVPMLFKNSEAPCFMTPPSLPLIDLLVKDSIKVQHLKGLKPIFSTGHLKRMMRNVIPTTFRKKRTASQDFEFEFFDAGHILGSASTLLENDNNSVFFTADIKLGKTQLHEGAELPKRNADFLITESTYGSREHENRKEVEKRFADSCREVCDRDGNVLVPAFAVGRAQEVIMVLKNHGFEYPVFMDGMSREAAQIMLSFPKYLRDFKKFHEAANWCDWIDSSGKRKMALDQPGVVVSTAGMLQGGPAIHYLFRMKDLPNQAVFFSGFQPPDSPGKGLLETKRFKYEDVSLDCSGLRVDYFDFSAHSGAEDLHEIIRKTNPKAVFIVHGDDPNATALAEWTKRETGAHVFIPRLGEKINASKYK